MKLFFILPNVFPPHTAARWPLCELHSAQRPTQHPEGTNTRFVVRRAAESIFHCAQPFLLFLLFFTACFTTSQTLLTDDGISLAYTYTPAENKNLGFVLIHMLNRNRHDYNKFAAYLSKNNYPSIAIDLRGHGDNQGNWQTYTPKDYNAMTLDAQAAIEYLHRRGVKKIILVGASIGANIALNTAVKDTRVAGTVLISPGFDYKGVTTQEAAQQVQTPVLLIAAADDPDAKAVVHRLEKLIPAQKERILYPAGGHGTNLFDKHPLEQRILKWTLTI